MHEASQWEETCFITLTYDDLHVPSDGSLRYSDFQKFIRSLRKHVRPVRFYMCGEYGEELGRPHYHAALFNTGFREDRYVWRDFGSGCVVYRSALLEKCWPWGMSSVGELTSQSAAYVARYVMKKVTGQPAQEHYESVCKETGVMTWKQSEFTRMSLKPGVGAKWFEKYGTTDVFPHDRVVFKGREVKVPRYYDTLYGRKEPETLEAIKEDREARARLGWRDNTPERLADREKVEAARLSFYRRKLK